MKIDIENQEKAELKSKEETPKSKEDKLIEATKALQEALSLFSTAIK